MPTSAHIGGDRGANGKGDRARHGQTAQPRSPAKSAQRPSHSTSQQNGSTSHTQEAVAASMHEDTPGVAVQQSPRTSSIKAPARRIKHGRTTATVARRISFSSGDRMIPRQGLHQVAGFDVNAGARELTERGNRGFLLPDGIKDRRTFFDGVRQVLPLDPPVVGHHSWDALSDSLWSGLAGSP